MKNIYRQITDNDPVSVPVMKGIAAVCAMIAVLMVLMAALTIWNQPIPVNNDNVVYEADPDWAAEQQRLARKHGPGHVIIYEPGETPYYYCGENKDRKCSFM
jgi:D-alanyl-D-alanine dipeptidase